MPSPSLHDHVRLTGRLPAPAIAAPPAAPPAAPRRADPARTPLGPAAPRRAWYAARPALAVYTAALVLHLVLLSAMIPPHGPAVSDRLQAWDGRLYTQIAAEGYPHGFTYTPDGELTGNNLAFFPLYPLAVRAVHAVTGLGWGTAAIVAAQLATIAALLIVHQLLTRLYTRRTATVGIVLLAAAQPMSITFFMAYSESLFLALAAATLLAAHRRAWLTAGCCAFLTGLTRPVGVAVVAALALAALIQLRRERRLSWRPIAATLLACTSTPGYLWWVAERVGPVDAWFTIQEAGWGTHWDRGSSLWQFLTETLHSGEGWVPVSVAVLLLAHLLAALLACRRTTWPPLLVHGAVIIVLTLGQSNYYHCKLRLLTPALIFLIPTATALAKARPATRALVLAASALFGCWYGAYMLTTWHYAI
ncbi:glycosyltransferase family 39 protein [Kitasatospora cystarginea]|uniref:Glycosyltransferase family 39 protein n=1 Tax=Kitasatospora cystarginea TaxID=58350 RepID=A0ABN3DKC2_9ACTN